MFPTLLLLWKKNTNTAMVLFPATSAAAAAEQAAECKVTISCEVNGRTVAQRTEKVPPLAQSYEESLLLTPAPLSPSGAKPDMDG